MCRVSSRRTVSRSAPPSELQSITDALTASLDDIKETLHTAPNTLVNFNNIYEPANGSLTGTLQVNNFAKPDLVPVRGDTGRIQDGRRPGRQTLRAVPGTHRQEPAVQLPPLGENLFVGAQARPNEVTYSEDWMRRTLFHRNRIRLCHRSPDRCPPRR